MSNKAVVNFFVSFICVLSAKNIFAEGIVTNTNAKYGPMENNLAQTQSVSMTGGEANDILVDVRLSKEYGGIGAGLVLNGLNVVEDRSIAGAGWQTSYLVRAPNNGSFFAFNQAAGNSETMWGMSNTFSTLSPAINSFTGVYQSNALAQQWNTLFADQEVPYGQVFQARSPIVPNHSYSFHSGRPSIDLERIPVSTGSVVKITNAYSIKATLAQTWDMFAIEQALYLNWQYAAYGGLRAYFGTGTGPSQKVLLNGPDISLPSDIGVLESKSDSLTNYKIDNYSKMIKYVVFVWNIKGKDIGVAIEMPTNPAYKFDGAHLRLEKLVYGPGNVSANTAPDYTWGNISWHTWFAHNDTAKGDGQTSFQNGEIRSYYLNYYVGTPVQLAQMGFLTE